MPTLRQALEALPHRDVRAIATRLAVRHRDEHRKDLWIAHILEAWANPTRQAQILAALSPTAHRAAARLASAGELPASLFLAEYGAVRRPRRDPYTSSNGSSRPTYHPPPWATPATISEELYYCGLLAPTEAVPLEKAQRLTLPLDLQPLFAPAAATSQPEAPLPTPDAPEHPLLHDLTQTLCFLLEEAAQHAEPVSLLQGRWLSPADMARLNTRLLRPDPTPLPRSHARCRRLRFLFFLATAAGLLANSDLTPSAWAWLSEPPDARWLRLWNAWRTAPLALRRAYRQPTASMPEPWPDLALRHLSGLPAAFTPSDLAQTILGHETALTAFFNAHLADLSALDAVTADLLDTLATDWGIVAALAGPPPTFRLTAFGRRLLDPTWRTDAAPGPAVAAEPIGRLEISSVGEEVKRHEWRLYLSPWAPAQCLAQLAPYAVRVGPIAADSPCHIYRLTEETVATAATVGHGLPTLLEALSDLGIALSPEQQGMLRTWHDRGHELQLLVLPIVRARRPELLAQLLQHAEGRAGLGELLAPTIAVAMLPPAKLAARLAAAGFYLRRPSEPGRTPDRSSGNEGREPEAEARPAPARCQAPPQGSSRQNADPRNGALSTVRQGNQTMSGDRNPIAGLRAPAVLWLAGQLYAALGEHLALPLPPAFADLDALLAAFDPADQALVQAQWDRLRNDLLAALDGRTFAPPPQPTDPERWRPLIKAAIAAGRSLTMRYFTAGRNVLTERTVTPHWIEEHRGVPYLRADCHLAGRILLFRLDRIQEVVEW